MKKVYIIAAIIFLICLSAISLMSPKSENLYAVNKKQKGAYINKSGVAVLKPKYKFAYQFAGDYAIVQGNNLNYGVIDKKGNVVIDFEYEELNNISENVVTYKKDGKYGYIDIPKNKKIEAIYDDIKGFKEGLAAVCIAGKWGFINKKGDFIIEPKYYNVSNFSEGLAAVSSSEHTTAGYINKKGKMVISFKENNLSPREFHEGLVPVIKGHEETCSYINKKGKTVIDNKKIYPIKIYCGDFNEGLTVFYIDNVPTEITTGYIDQKGKIKYSLIFTLPKDVQITEFSALGDFSSEMAPVTIDYKTGYINNKFEFVIPPIYEFARGFNGDLAYVKFENKEGYINKKGHWVWSKPREGM